MKNKPNPSMPAIDKFLAEYRRKMKAGPKLKAANLLTRKERP